MKFSSNKKAELPSFQMTSMMDVVFLLLCFFVTTSVFSQWEYEVDIALPSAESGVVPDRLPGEIIINIDKSGQIMVNQVEYTEQMLLETCRKLSSIYKGHPVVVRADKETDYADVLNVIDICRQADIWQISFATDMNQGSGAKYDENIAPTEIK
ncbi:MAG: biopolymer transporter ExbD [Kiritimatiellae bacterium]|nr:biopolymer transporter ExbD [Kiritimatiellia bacterium]